MKPARTQPVQPEAGAVVAKAALRAAEDLQLSDAVLAKVIGVSAPTIWRLRRSGRMIDPAHKEGELALIFLRMYRGLQALLGGDSENCRRWLKAENAHLGGVPSELIQTVGGLVNVTQYLDAMRGKN
jgi:hypothetical protein